MPKAILELPEMPGTCFECKLGSYDPLFDVVTCYVLHENISPIDRPEFCPLKPVEEDEVE